MNELRGFAQHTSTSWSRQRQQDEAPCQVLLSLQAALTVPYNSIHSLCHAGHMHKSNHFSVLQWWGSLQEARVVRESPTEHIVLQLRCRDGTNLISKPSSATSQSLLPNQTAMGASLTQTDPRSDEHVAAPPKDHSMGKEVINHFSKTLPRESEGNLLAGRLTAFKENFTQQLE